MSALTHAARLGADQFHMLNIDELTAAMPLCQDVSFAGRREPDLRTPLTPEHGRAIAAAIAGQVNV